MTYCGKEKCQVLCQSYWTMWCGISSANHESCVWIKLYFGRLLLFFFLFFLLLFFLLFFEALSILPIYYLIRKFVHSVSFLFLSFGSYRNLVNYYFKSSRLVFLTFSYHVHLHLSTFSQVMFNHLNIVYVFQSYLCSLSYANFSSTFS